MNAFSAELGTKLADQWAKIIVVPGLIWMLLLTIGLQLGQADAFDVPELRSRLDRLAQDPAAHALGTVVVAVAAFSGASAVGGLAADGLGRVLQRAWTSTGTSGFGALLLSVRRHHRKAAKARLDQAVLGKAALDGNATLKRSLWRRSMVARRLRKAGRAFNRLGPKPTRPTRIADCFARTTERLATVHGLTDFPRAWPRLWTVLPDALRADVTEACDAYAAASRMIGWGLLYTLLAAAWWPAAPLGIAIMLSGVGKARATAFALAELIETSVELHASDLAKQLGLEIATPRRPKTTGQTITRCLADEQH